MRGFILAAAMAAGVIAWPQPPVRAEVPYIDTHAHLHGLVGRDEWDWDGAAKLAIQVMDDLGIVRTLIMPPPFPPDFRGAYSARELAHVAARYPDRFSFLAGGDTLNPLLIGAARANAVGPDLIGRFRAEAEKIVAAGAAGFGELTVDHLSLGPDHPYIAAPPDHPLLLLLADIAAERDLPIELHMEAIERRGPLGAKYRSPPNPATLEPNMAAFERLLAHNRKARIVWSHLGWDNTGQRTVALTRRLMSAHGNLFANIKIGPDSLPDNRPMQRGEGLLSEWAELIAEFPDRVMLGSDQFYVTPRSTRRFPQHMRPVRALLNELPEPLARKVGTENAMRIYRLGR